MLKPKSLSSDKDIFNEILPLCKRTNEIINDVFNNNEKIMEQFVKDLFQFKVQVFLILIFIKLIKILNLKKKELR